MTQQIHFLLFSLSVFEQPLGKCGSSVELNLLCHKPKAQPRAAPGTRPSPPSNSRKAAPPARGKAVGRAMPAVHTGTPRPPAGGGPCQWLQLLLVHHSPSWWPPQPGEGESWELALEKGREVALLGPRIPACGGRAAFPAPGFLPGGVAGLPLSA